MEYVTDVLLFVILAVQVYVRWGPERPKPPETLPASKETMQQLIAEVEKTNAALAILQQQNHSLYHALR